MPADPVEAGRKGGRSRSLKKLLACRRNGFQARPKPFEEQAKDVIPTQQPALIEEESIAPSSNA
jgi:hypothetical protein